MINKFWGRFNIETQEHFYHGGGHIENRHAMVEALVFNFELQPFAQIPQKHLQMELQFVLKDMQSELLLLMDIKKVISKKYM